MVDDNVREDIAHLVQELMSGGDRYRTASYELRSILARKRPDVTNEQIHQILKPAISYLAKKVENAELLPHTTAKISDEVASAVSTLGWIGDASVIPTLEKLRDRVAQTGIKREFIQTEIAAGETSTQDTINTISYEISKIEQRTK